MVPICTYTRAHCTNPVNIKCVDLYQDSLFVPGRLHSPDNSVFYLRGERAVQHRHGGGRGGPPLHQVVQGGRDRGRHDRGAPAAGLHPPLFCF